MEAKQNGVRRQGGTRKWVSACKGVDTDQAIDSGGPKGGLLSRWELLGHLHMLMLTTEGGDVDRRDGARGKIFE